jgi:hypothetical protein
MNKLVVVAKALFREVDRETLPQQGTVNVDATIARAIHARTAVITHAFVPMFPAELIRPVAGRSAIGLEHTTRLTEVQL